MNKRVWAEQSLNQVGIAVDLAPLIKTTPIATTQM
jgi:hypothetical protein